MQEKSLGMQGLSSPAITTTTRNRQKWANGTEEASPRLQPPSTSWASKNYKSQKTEGGWSWNSDWFREEG
jgi:hypothetical protein